MSRRLDFVVDARRPLQLRHAQTKRFVILPRLLHPRLQFLLPQRLPLPYLRHRLQRVLRLRVRQHQGRDRPKQALRPD